MSKRLQAFSGTQSRNLGQIPDAVEFCIRFMLQSVAFHLGPYNFTDYCIRETSGWQSYNMDLWQAQHRNHNAFGTMECHLKYRIIHFLKTTYVCQLGFSKFRKLNHGIQIYWFWDCPSWNGFCQLQQVLIGPRITHWKVGDLGSRRDSVG